MASIKIGSFAGIAPKVSAKLLADNAAQLADNCRFLSGTLRAFSEPLIVTTNSLRAGGEIKSIFRMASGNNAYWLSWLTDVNVVRSQIAGNTDQRIYWTGDNEPRISNLAMAIAGAGAMPNSWFVLGVPSPLVAPTVAVTGGVAADVTRAYIETFVTPWGEESAPSPASALRTGKPDGTWSLSGLNVAPINTAAITGVTVLNGIATVSTASTAYLRTGEELTIAGIVGLTDLNGNRIITEVTNATTFKVALTSAQTYTSGGTWTRAAPHNTAGMTRRIYRSLIGVYFFVAEIPVTTLTYTDAVAETALGESVRTIGWRMPPAGMKGIIALPNGFNAAYIGNEVIFSEPYYPHSWPDKYKLACISDIVALGAFGSSMVAGTKGTPYIFTGTHPDGISMEKTEVAEPCLSSLGMVDAGSGVIYPSPNGLVFIGMGGTRVITEEIYSRDEWLLLSPSTLKMAFFNGMVFGWHLVNSLLKSGLTFDMRNGQFSAITAVATATYTDPDTNTLYIVKGGGVFQWDSHPNNDIPYEWKSKKFYTNRPLNFSYARIDGDFTGVADINAAIAADLAFNIAAIAAGLTYGELDNNMLDEYTLNGSILKGGSALDYATRYMNFVVYADEVEVYNASVETDNIFSLPGGFKAYTWEFKFSGNIEANNMIIAESSKEIRMTP